MAKIYEDLTQGSEEWLAVRLGKPTASEFDAIMTPEFEARKGDMPKTYLNKKLAEQLLKRPLPGFGSFDTEQGQILEDEARARIVFENDLDVRNVGFVESEDGRCGCSPDGLIGDDSGMELKCPRADTHIGYLRGGCVPKAYAAQVHGSLYVTGRKEWRFYSYHRGLPTLSLVVPRDEEIMGKIKAALAGFYREFDKALSQLSA